MDTGTNPTREAALRYLERGFRIIPLHRTKEKWCSCKEGGNCKSAGKHPIELAWQKGEALGLDDVDRWWGIEYPKNIGIATGPDSGILVVDVDPDSGGGETVKALMAEHGNEWVDTYWAKTGSGGRHLFYRYPDDGFEYGNSAGKIGKGVDTRGKGGYVVAAPSRSAKGSYVEHPKPIADAPEWLLEMLRPKERQRSADAPKNLDNIPEGERNRLEGYVEGAVEHEVGRLRELSEKGWDGPPWDITTYEVACNLIELSNAPWSSLTHDQALDIVFDNAPRDEGFDNARVNAKIDSAIKTVGDNEAAYPPKPSDAFWMDDEDLGSPASREVAEASPAEDDFIGPEPVVELPGVINGLPVSESGVIVPDYALRASAKALLAEYRARDALGVQEGPEVPLESVLRPLELPAEESDLAEVDAWLGRNLRSGTPEQLWAAVGTFLEGKDPDAPVLVLKGASGPLLALLARAARPEVGDDVETVHAGPRVSTREHPGNQVVFEFAEEPIDLWPHAKSIAQRALSNAALVRSEDRPHHDDFDETSDYRVAQMLRARHGMGSQRRSEED